MFLDTDILIYTQLKECLCELGSLIPVRLICQDENLHRLGFVLSDKVPCTVEIIASDDELDHLIDSCYQFEVDAFNTPNGLPPNKKSKEYQNYLRYTWIADLLSK